MPTGAKIQPRALTMEVMAQLRERMGRLELNYSDVARKAEFSISQTTKILKGEKPVTLEELDILCEVLTVRLSAVVSAAEGRVRDGVPGSQADVYGELMSRPAGQPPHKTPPAKRTKRAKPGEGRGMA